MQQRSQKEEMNAKQSHRADRVKDVDLAAQPADRILSRNHAASPDGDHEPVPQRLVASVDPGDSGDPASETPVEPIEAGAPFEALTPTAPTGTTSLERPRSLGTMSVEAAWRS